MKKIKFGSIILTFLFNIVICLLTVTLTGIFYLTVTNKFNCSYDEGKLKSRIEYLEAKNDMLVEFCKIKSSDDQAYYSQKLKENFKSRIKIILKDLRGKIK